MGSRGPVPKRSDQRLGHRSKSEATKITVAPAAADTAAPMPSDEWHPVALRWYESLAKSGQSKFYEPSDWATAYLIAESISRDLNPQVVGITERGDAVFESIPLKGASLSAYLKAFGNLLTTEGDRRRASIELQGPVASDPGQEHADATVTDLMDRIGG